MASEPDTDSSTRAATGTPPPTIVHGSTVPAGGPAAVNGTTADGKPTVSQELFRRGDVVITREQVIGGDQFGDKVVISTGAGDDRVNVDQRRNGVLDVNINGSRYEITLAPGQELGLRTGDGNDVVMTRPRVSVNMDVDGGAGNDTITTGAGRDRIDGGAGNDTIRSGDGRDDVFGNTGNDTIDAGRGNDVVYGGDGNDRLLGGDGRDYIEGGKGNDRIDGGRGDDVLSGGLGDDNLVGGRGNDRVYTGAGADRVDNRSGNDAIYGQSGSDNITVARGASNRVVEVDMTAAIGASVTVNGSAGFTQRTEADIEMLRSSPNGRQMLGELDRAADPVTGTGKSTTITELQNEYNGSAGPVTPPTYLRPGPGGATVAGGGENTTVSYNPSNHSEQFPAPPVVLFHELSHAYNGVNGTAQRGTYAGAGPDNGINNDEMQAVGLNNGGAAFDFDRDPATPATTANPKALSENGLREEMGLPQRPNYNVGGWSGDMARADLPTGLPAAGGTAFAGIDSRVSGLLAALDSGDPAALRAATQRVASSEIGQSFREETIRTVDQLAQAQPGPVMEMATPGEAPLSMGPRR
ncbi:M91 family zinc metallopeptidase [Lysobacter capsici]|uniref:M91 family zinc metallopeptidase n=1 Tax=Lysobacter capsici TaxID=435897 RepID=UPI001BFFE5AD|nr:M91 family zinc metallopeptidase [Lysobacter capsici]QWF15371.1 hypothetical protein KME82_16440 [Lysobacter capsici]